MAGQNDQPEQQRWAGGTTPLDSPQHRSGETIHVDSPERALLMGVVNVTPDSFSDGGNWLEPAAAIAHGAELAEQGADIIDIGGESTRPGAQRITADEELRRVLPVVTALAGQGLCVSVDTMRAQVGRQVIEAGARIINDVSGGLADPEMFALIAASDVDYVVMHWRGHSADMYGKARYDDVVGEVKAELAGRVAAAADAGIDPARVIVDPGLGFAKRPEHNWALLARLAEISCLAVPGAPFRLLVGPSRKSFLGRLLAGRDGEPRSFVGSDDATVALTTVAAMAGAWCVRVHAVPSNADAVRVVARLRQEGVRLSADLAAAPQLGSAAGSEAGHG
jgi:dihydropteroate synthase